MARFCTLASGSTGNSTYISTSGGDILVDVGISFKALMTAIDAAGGRVSNLRAIAVTHTHTDHIKGLKTFLKNVNVPVIASTDTLNHLSNNNFLPEGTSTIVANCGEIDLGGTCVDFFETKHDAAGSGGYVIKTSDGRRAAVCTDIGIMTDTVRQKLRGCEVVLIESNHDINMLQRGPYPAQLKLRILSDEGHLSNNACATELPFLLNNGTSRIILGHISMENNTPILALSTARSALAEIGAKDGVDYILEAAKPKSVGVTVF